MSGHNAAPGRRRSLAGRTTEPKKEIVMEQPREGIRQGNVRVTRFCDVRVVRSRPTESQQRHACVSRLCEHPSIHADDAVRDWRGNKGLAGRAVVGRPAGRLEIPPSCLWDFIQRLKAACTGSGLLFRGTFNALIGRSKAEWLGISWDGLWIKVFDRIMYVGLDG